MFYQSKLAELGYNIGSKSVFLVISLKISAAALLIRLANI